MADLFISYSSQNADYVRRLAAFLEGRGFDVWFDDEIETGSSWSDTIFGEIDRCAAFLVVMSPQSLASNWVERECLYAERRRKPLFPLLLEGEEFPFLINVQYTDVRGGQLLPDSTLSLLHEAVAARPAEPALIAPAPVATAPIAPAPMATVPAAPVSRSRVPLVVGTVVLIGIVVTAIALFASTRPAGSSSTPAAPTQSPSPTDQEAPSRQPRLVPGRPTIGLIDDSTPEHWYQFEVDAGSTITLRMESLGRGLDPYLEVYGPGDRLLASNDELNDNFDDASLDAGISLTARETGTYHVKATRFPAEGTDQPVTSGSFRLTLSLDPAR